jgi:hypothetical protein
MSVRQVKVVILLISLMFLVLPIAQGQSRKGLSSLIFISDCQQPLATEKLIRKSFNNEAGRDTLFREIENRTQGYVFMPGDLVGKGSKGNEWSGVDAFLKTLRDKGTKVYAIPGNHEYLFNTSRGIAQYRKRFPELPITGYCVRTDSMAIVMLNSNFRHLSAAAIRNQQKWYGEAMDSLDSDPSVRLIIVCTHHSPYSNSKVVGSSVKVQQAFIPRFEASPKTKLFVTGHSHNLEYFAGSNNKKFMVIGGGGGIDQPLYTGGNEKYRDLIRQETKPRFFYVVLQRSGNLLDVTIRGFSLEMKPTALIRVSL